MTAGDRILRLNANCAELRLWGSLEYFSNLFLWRQQFRLERLRNLRMVNGLEDCLLASLLNHTRLRPPDLDFELHHLALTFPLLLLLL